MECYSHIIIGAGKEMTVLYYCKCWCSGEKKDWLVNFHLRPEDWSNEIPYWYLNESCTTQLKLQRKDVKAIFTSLRRRTRSRWVKIWFSYHFSEEILHKFKSSNHRGNETSF